MGKSGNSKGQNIVLLKTTGSFCYIKRFKRLNHLPSFVQRVPIQINKLGKKKKSLNVSMTWGYTKRMLRDTSLVLFEKRGPCEIF